MKNNILSPEYRRIPHFNKEISQMTHDDIQLETPIEFPFSAYISEKVDGANVGLAWLNEGPVVRNRKHILNKGYSKIRTPAKKQFQSVWNCAHEYRKDLIKINDLWQTPLCVFGEWMYAKHSIYYDKLPSLFIAYDIWCPEDNNFLSVHNFENLMRQTNINFVKNELVNIETIDQIIALSELPSNYYNGVSEGIVMKIDSGDYNKIIFKVVNKFFKRREDFNDELIKNKIIK
jgi:atypical dual specificity phosphatase